MTNTLTARIRRLTPEGRIAWFVAQALLSMTTPKGN